MSATSACPTRGSTRSPAIAGSAQIIPTRLTFVDIAGLVRGASKGEGLGNQFLANIREVDAIAHVVRCFEDADVTHVEGKIDPVADIETIETELMLADLDSLEKRVVGAREEGARAATRRRRRRSTSSTARWRSCAKASRPALVERKPEEERAFRDARPPDRRSRCSMSATSRRPRPTRATRFSRKVFERAAEEGAKAVVVSAKIESEIAVLPADEQTDYLEAVGPRRARPQPRHPRRLRASRPDHLLHRRAQGGARLDHHRGHARAAGGRRDPHRFREGLHPRRDHRLSRTTSRSRARPARATPASSGSRARNTWCRTATCCISASPPDRAATKHLRNSGETRSR